MTTRTCNHGHPMTPANTSKRKRADGRLRFVCLACERARHRKQATSRKQKRAEERARRDRVKQERDRMDARRKVREMPMRPDTAERLLEQSVRRESLPAYLKRDDERMWGGDA